MSEQPKTQAEKFADLARELECDEDEEAFDERLRRLAKAPPSKEEQPERLSREGPYNSARHGS
ncbi:MAG: hypothetical protein JWP50_2883 [Phenylobacterium sp.]|nr:hypothetical protein [Phenylobacterium sp.]